MGNKHKITAIEDDPKVAAIYQDHFPNNTVIVGDAHEYLRSHFKVDFIWSPRRPGPSEIRKNPEAWLKSITEPN